MLLTFADTQKRVNEEEKAARNKDTNYLSLSSNLFVKICIYMYIKCTNLAKGRNRTPITSQSKPENKHVTVLLQW